MSAYAPSPKAWMIYERPSERPPRNGGPALSIWQAALTYNGISCPSKGDAVAICWSLSRQMPYLSFNLRPVASPFSRNWRWPEVDLSHRSPTDITRGSQAPGCRTLTPSGLVVSPDPKLNRDLVRAFTTNTLVISQGLVEHRASTYSPPLYSRGMAWTLTIRPDRDDTPWLAWHPLRDTARVPREPVDRRVSTAPGTNRALLRRFREDPHGVHTSLASRRLGPPERPDVEKWDLRIGEHDGAEWLVWAPADPTATRTAAQNTGRAATRPR